MNKNDLHETIIQAQRALRQNYPTPVPDEFGYLHILSVDPADRQYVNDYNLARCRLEVLQATITGLFWQMKYAANFPCKTPMDPTDQIVLRCKKPGPTEEHLDFVLRKAAEFFVEYHYPKMPTKIECRNYDDHFAIVFKMGPDVK